MKKNVMIRIDADLVQKSKELGLNISKISENALKEMVKRIESPNALKEDTDCPDSSQNNNKWGCPDLNRGPESPSLRA